MRYFSIANKKLSGDFKDALFKGVADDNGLYIPESLPRFDKSFFEFVSWKICCNRISLVF